jgi:hypothetical protein
MNTFRSFMSGNSPFFILGLAILGLYLMAMAIGFSLNVHI